MTSCAALKEIKILVRRTKRIETTREFFSSLLQLSAQGCRSSFFLCVFPSFLLPTLTFFSFFFSLSFLRCLLLKSASFFRFSIFSLFPFSHFPISVFSSLFLLLVFLVSSVLPCVFFVSAHVYVLLFLLCSALCLLFVCVLPVFCLCFDFVLHLFAPCVAFVLPFFRFFVAFVLPFCFPVVCRLFLPFVVSSWIAIVVAIVSFCLNSCLACVLPLFCLFVFPVLSCGVLLAVSPCPFTLRPFDPFVLWPFSPSVQFRIDAMLLTHTHNNLSPSPPPTPVHTSASTH